MAYVGSPIVHLHCGREKGIKKLAATVRLISMDLTQSEQMQSHYVGTCTHWTLKKVEPKVNCHYEGRPKMTLTS